MRTLSAALATEIGRPIVSALIPLVEIVAATPIHRALHGADVSYGGDTYVSDVGAFAEITEDTEGRRTASELTLQNVVDTAGNALPWSTYLATNKLNGVEVKLHVYSSPADDAITVQRWYISGYTWDRTLLRIRLGSPHDALAFTVPTVPLVAPSCAWTYRAGECASTSDLPSCDKTPAACAARFPDGAALSIGPSWPFYTAANRQRRLG